MNRFGTNSVRKGIFLLLFFFCSPSYSAAKQSLNAVNSNPQPFHERNSHIFADIDTSRQLIYVLLQNDIWQYNLQTENWNKFEVPGLTDIDVAEFEFGYSHTNNSLLLWSRGIGIVYEIDLQSFELERIDRSFPQMNQFGHYPFIENGTIYAVGGYGLWNWNSLITFYNRNIREWNIVSVHRESPFPENRIPAMGLYLQETKELFIAGGEGSENNRQDDKNTFRVNYNDVWKYSFETMYWEKLDELELEQWKFFTSPQDYRISSINTNTTSFYSPKSKIWYLPVAHVEGSKEVYYLKPFNTSTGREYPVFELNLGESKDFLITNYLFHPASNELILIGLDFLTNTTSLPLSIRRIPEDSLFNKVKQNQKGVSERKRTLTMVAAFLLLFLPIGFYFKRTKGLNTQSFHLTETTIEEFEMLNGDEKKMLLTLLNEPSELESMKLEEEVWSHIHNYDYRRKLRNETINSINKKFNEGFSLSNELILRMKDPNDNRRLRYTLNPEYK